MRIQEEMVKMLKAQSWEDVRLNYLDAISSTTLSQFFVAFKKVCLFITFILFICTLIYFNFISYIYMFVCFIKDVKEEYRWSTLNLKKLYSKR
jgi:hypothetical protein